MSQLKPSFVKKIYDAAKSSCFTLSDFDFEFPKTGKTLAKISFKHHPDYRLILSERTERNTVKVKQGTHSYLSTTREEENSYTVHYLLESPGDFKLVEENEISSLDQLITKFPEWCKNIHSDLSTKFDTEDPFSSLREHLENIINENIEDEGEQFEQNEIEALEKKLDSLFEMFSELEEKNHITEKNLKNLKSELETIKSNAKIYPKGIWAKVTNNKLIQIVTDFAKTKEGRDLIIESIKKLITN